MLAFVSNFLQKNMFSVKLPLFVLSCDSSFAMISCFLTSFYFFSNFFQLLSIFCQLFFLIFLIFWCVFLFQLAVLFLGTNEPIDWTKIASNHNFDGSTWMGKFARWYQFLRTKGWTTTSLRRSKFRQAPDYTIYRVLSIKSTNFVARFFFCLSYIHIRLFFSFFFNSNIFRVHISVYLILEKLNKTNTMK